MPQGDAVVYEITKDDLEQILKRRQALAERLREILARRHLHGRQEERILGRRAESRAARPWPHVWRERVRAFFGLGQDD
jgi:CRP-like cAMP-binding protein